MAKKGSTESTFKKKALISWELFKPQLKAYLKDKMVEQAIKKMLGSAWATGIRGWLVKYGLEYAYDHIADPAIDAIFRESKYTYRIIDKSLIISKMKKAQEDGDAQAYDNAVDDLYS